MTFEGKSVLITGAAGSVGLKTAEVMIYLKAKVIMACRNAEKAQRARAALLAEYPDAEIRILCLDLADLGCIDGFVRQIKETGTDIDVFLNNAGVFHKPGERTADGFDKVLGTNYLGVYYLTESILPYLETLPHEVLYVNTVSIVNKIATVDYGDFFYSENYNNFSVYARSKLCLSRYTLELSKRCEGTNIRALMCHPGIVMTPLSVGAFGNTVKRLSEVFGGIFNSPEKSSLALPFIMANDVPAGSIVGPSKLFGGWGYPEINKIPRRVKTGGTELLDFSQKQINGVKR